MTIYRNSLMLLLVALLFTSESLIAQNTDRVKIDKAVEKYIIGWRTGNKDILREAFELEAGVVLWVDKKGSSETLRSMTLADLINTVKPHEDYGLGYEIQHLDVVDSQLAMAKVRIPLPKQDSYYIDYLQLQKLNDTWKIILKSFVYFRKQR